MATGESFVICDMCERGVHRMCDGVAGVKFATRCDCPYRCSEIMSAADYYALAEANEKSGPETK